jgi:hypothetical protein
METKKVIRTWSETIPIETTGMTPEQIRKAEAIWLREYKKEK